MAANTVGNDAYTDTQGHLIERFGEFIPRWSIIEEPETKL